jgi:hypothetical protein
MVVMAAVGQMVQEVEVVVLVVEVVGHVGLLEMVVVGL